MKKQDSPRWSDIWPFSALALIAILAWISSGVPLTATNKKDPADFSATRAMQHIERIATAPHPAGTAENDAVRNYIVGALRGLDVEVLEDAAHVASSNQVNEVHNVLARIPGTANTSGFAVVAHYDSTAWGPGAADDGAGVAAMIETVRALKSAPPLMNDVIFVFTDGEERGLVGARAFCRHPWAANVGLLLNLEARGTSGPSLMFETSENNGWLIRQLIASGAPLRANSLAYDIYSRMPNKSDFTVLRANGFRGYNIAFIEDFHNYHTANDKPEKLSLRSLQHHGDHALRLARHFGNMPIQEIPAEPDAIFFNLIGDSMIQYPASWGPVLTAIASLLFVTVVGVGAAKRRLTVRELIAGAGVVFVAALSAVLICGLIMTHAWYRSGPYVLYRTTIFSIFFFGIAGALAFAFFQRSRSRIPTAALVAGGLFWWFVLLLAVQATFPLGSYAALFPLVFGTLGLIIVMARPEPLGFWDKLIYLLMMIVPMILITSLLRGLLASLTVVLSPLILIPLVMLLALLAPYLRYSTQQTKLSGLYSVIAVAFVYTITSPYGLSSSPKMNSVSYGLDRTTGSAHWMSTDRELDDWTSQFFPKDAQKHSVQEFVPYERNLCFKSEAPVAELPSPTVELLSDIAQPNGSRRVTLRITSAMAAPEVHLNIDDSVIVYRATACGQHLSNIYGFHYSIFPRCGYLITEFVVQGEGPIRGTVTEVAFELPDIPHEPRPYGMIVKPNTLDWLEKNELRSGHTYVVTPFQVGPGT